MSGPGEETNGQCGEQAIKFACSNLGKDTQRSSGNKLCSFSFFSKFVTAARQLLFLAVAGNFVFVLIMQNSILKIKHEGRLCRRQNKCTLKHA